MEDSKTKKVQRNIWQKLDVIKNNLAEAGGNRNAFLNLAKEQECLAVFDDDIIGGFCKSVIRLIDIDTGNEVSASGIVDVKRENFIVYSRTYALKSLLGCFDNNEKLFSKGKSNAPTQNIPVQNAQAQSPTPARTPSEPSGGVPKGFTGFNK